MTAISNESAGQRGTKRNALAENVLFNLLGADPGCPHLVQVGGAE